MELGVGTDEVRAGWFRSASNISTTTCPYGASRASRYVGTDELAEDCRELGAELHVSFDMGVERSRRR